MKVIYCMTHDVGIKVLPDNQDQVMKFWCHDHKLPCVLREFETEYPKGEEVKTN